jgi:uncharacterized protein (TIGR00369 family)
MTNDQPTRGHRSPVFTFLDGVIEEARDGRSRVRFAKRPEFTIPGGFVQSGIQGALIDEGMIVAVHSLLPPGERYTTAELKVNYLRPAAGESFLCESEVIRRGRSLIYVESSLLDDQGRLVARASSSLVRVERHAAGG